MLRVGLTGGIGCGKSVVATYFAALDIPIIDTDVIAHRLTGTGGEALPAIQACFGDAVLQVDGTLSRANMRHRIFSNVLERKKLEAIVHPLILQDVRQQLQTFTHSPYVLVVIPLLLSTDHYQNLIDRVLVVDCSETQQIARVKERSALSTTEIKDIMAVQPNRSALLAGADDVLTNTGNLAFLKQQIAPLHHKYLELSRKQL
jgi:dephospho-CoA kinase